MPDKSLTDDFEGLSPTNLFSAINVPIKSISMTKMKSIKTHIISIRYNQDNLKLRIIKLEMYLRGINGKVFCVKLLTGVGRKQTTILAKILASLFGTQEN